MHLDAIVEILDQIAPPSLAFEFDHIGLQIGNSNQDIQSALVTLDHSKGAIQQAIQTKCQLIVAHHPFIWDPLAQLNDSLPWQADLLKMVQNGIAGFAIHTNWDCAVEGVSETLAQKLNLQEITDCGSANFISYSEVSVFVPEAHAKHVQKTTESFGFATHGQYQGCSFRSSGFGRFKPREGTSPFVGQPGEVSVVEETKIEWSIPSSKVTLLIEAVRRVHPYEEPVFVVKKCEPKRMRSVGRIGSLAQPCSFEELVRTVDQNLKTRSMAWGDPCRTIKSVAVSGGAADSEWTLAQAAGADAFVTGEIRQHIAVEADHAGFPVIAAGHHATEHPGMVKLTEILKSQCPEVNWTIYDPELGSGGRPL